MANALVPTLFYILVFPGFLFMGAAGVLGEYVDRKLHARMQNRAGPPWFQPVADFVKLLSKEDLVPAGADRTIFKLMPVLALAGAATAFLYVPLWSTTPLHSFEGDLVVVIYLLTIPTFCFFLGGWYSRSLYAGVGAVRTLTQLFAYEVPLFMAVLGPAALAGTWSLAGMAEFYQQHPAYALVNLPGFGVAVVALLGKLEKVPFDLPEAEAELAGGTFVEYSGRLLAFFRLTLDVETGVAASLVAAVFLPWGMSGLPVVVAFALYAAKVLFIIFLMAFLRSLFARLRIDQMVAFCWRWLAPAALIQLALDVLLCGVLHP
jgi:NADH-quinone oxidoreductase subunit H